MLNEILIAGSGGQGVMLMGQLLAYGAVYEGLEVTFFPSYGPEMRGGTANCTVVIADEEIGSPLVRNPKAVIALNLPSLDKYERMVVAGGVLVANASLINRGPSRTDIKSVFIPANEIAESTGNKRLLNMVALGAMLEALPVLPLEAIKQALTDHLPERHRRLLPENFQALHEGADFAQKVLATQGIATS